MTVFLLVLMAAIAFGQATPVGVMRIANATTAFGINLPIGSIVVNIATNTQWQANAGVVSTATLTTASSSFVQINATSATNLSTGSNTSTAINITSSTGTAATLNSATSTLAGLESAADNVKLGQLSTTASQTYTFPSSSATIPANNQGFYIGTTQVHINDASGTTTSLGINITGSSASCTGNAATATSATTAATANAVVAGGVTLGMMANETANTILGNNTGSSATPTALTGTQVRSLTNTNRATETFEDAADSTAGHYIVHLSNTPLSGTVSVIMNGTPLSSSQFSIVQTSYCRIALSAYFADKVLIQYSY